MLQASLDQVQKVLHEELEQFFSAYIKEVKHFDAWSEEIAGRLQEYSLRPGKAIRPWLLAVGAAAGATDTVSQALSRTDVRTLMMVVELTHKRLILMDDIADQDELRNDLPAFHIMFENDLRQRPQYQKLSDSKMKHIARSYSEAAGIWLQALTWRLVEVAELPKDVHKQVVSILIDRVYQRTPVGWYILLDQNLETLEQQVSEEKVLKGLEFVTSEYTFITPLLLGVVLGGASKETLQALENYGRKAGLLFQLTDDVLGLYGDPEVTGKPSGNDVREGKKTLLVHYAYQAGTPEQKVFLERVVGNESLSQDEVEQVRALVHSTGAYEKTQAFIQKLGTEAQADLISLPQSEAKELLLTLIAYLMQRQK